jgi:anthranilate synthase/aminodeoxychorismate synthase-like glutamine amidotransferase
MILLIDNYDSFVYNLARYFQQLGLAVEVVRNDRITVEQVQQRVDSGQIRGLVLSPGPCSPDQAGVCLGLVARLYQRLPLLGICLGHQAIAQALGGEVVRGPAPVHGQADWIYHDQQYDLQGLPQPFIAGRYHSLIVREETLPSFFDISARLSDGTIMALRHKRLPIVGYQFHPESILTPPGLALLAGFCRWSGLGPLTTIDIPTGPQSRPRELCDDYPPGCQPRSPVAAGQPGESSTGPEADGPGASRSSGLPTSPVAGAVLP